MDLRVVQTSILKTQAESNNFAIHPINTSLGNITRRQTGQLLKAGATKATMIKMKT